MSTVAGPLLLLYLVITLAKSLLSALSLWCVAEGTFKVFWANPWNTEMPASLEARSRLFYSRRIFRSMARLDAPTWDNPAVSSHISALFTKFNDSDAVAWTAITTLTETGSAFLGMFSEAEVLFGVLQGQGDGSLLVLVSLASVAVSFFALKGGFSLGNTWAATTRDSDYIKMEGLNRVVSDTRHRKELVAGGLDEFLTEGIINVPTEYRSLADRLRDRVKDFWSAYSSSRRNVDFAPIRLLRVPIQELPQIIFTLQVVQKPSSIPVSLASLHLLQQSSSTFMMRIHEILQDVESISTRLSNLRNLYEAENIANKVIDGIIPFPENAYVHLAPTGMSRSDILEAKGTILQLAARMFDPMEGSILIDGHDIKTLRLAVIRRAMAILFQDYTLFPLSIRDNIAMGNPRRARDNAAIEEAARLGGASELIAQLPDGFDAYLARPVSDIYSGSPDGTGALLCQKFIGDTTNQELSGGQTQSSPLRGRSCGLRQWDKRSLHGFESCERTKRCASFWKPYATRRSHFFSLYMDDSAIVETGTHEGLLKHEGSDYGRLWRMHAEAFL
ncbi:hypothetical protein EDB85DRAFT_1891504 [Lactarius pseudohatsudake]|nr:hypothetical protein EDB85DRAFT_1891504 [Lactarius pseudohatsudake]